MQDAVVPGITAERLTGNPLIQCRWLLLSPLPGRGGTPLASCVVGHEVGIKDRDRGIRVVCDEGKRSDLDEGPARSVYFIGRSHCFKGRRILFLQFGSNLFKSVNRLLFIQIFPAAMTHLR